METEANSDLSINVPNRENGEEASSESQPQSAVEMEPNPEWLVSMEDRIQKPPKLLNKSAGRSSCCIFRVPQSLVEINQKFYQPHIASIGPFHHGKLPQLNMIQEHKWRLLGALLTRTQRHGVGLNDFYKAIAAMESKIRECYSETIELETQELVEMMVLDGCFIIEVFCIVGRLVLTDLDDPIFNLAWILSFLMRDLLQLENQIPYFVLETLFEMSIASSGIENLPSLPSLALEFFNYMIERPPEVLARFKNGTGNHLLDLFRQSFLPQDPLPDISRSLGPALQLIPPAKKLHLAGVRFKPRKSSCFLDIRFSNGVLEIPTFTIDDFTSSVFLNFVAFEQCYNHCSKHITTYATFMGCLINTPIDAGFLCDHKVLENYFGTDEEIARFFNNLGKDVAFDIQRTYLAKQFRDVNEYYRNNWHVRWAGFKHTYFDTPWSFISALAAVFLLVLTMIQSFFSVYGYIRPPHSP